MASPDSFGAKGTLDVDGTSYEIFRLERRRPATASTSTSLPYSLKVLLENLLRTEDGAEHHRRPHPGAGRLGRRRRARTRRSSSRRRA